MNATSIAGVAGCLAMIAADQPRSRARISRSNGNAIIINPIAVFSHAVSASTELARMPAMIAAPDAIRNRAVV
jgi:hypothetical protein